MYTYHHEIGKQSGKTRPARHTKTTVLSANGSHSKRNTRHSALLKTINIHAKDGLQQCKRCPFRWQKATFCKTSCREHRTHKTANAATFCNTCTYVCTRKTAIFWPAAFYFTKNALTEARRKTICKQTRPMPLHFGNSHCAYKQPYMRITGGMKITLKTASTVRRHTVSSKFQQNWRLLLRLYNTTERL